MRMLTAIQPLVRRQSLGLRPRLFLKPNEHSMHHCRIFSRLEVHAESFSTSPNIISRTRRISDSPSRTEPTFFWRPWPQAGSHSRSDQLTPNHLASPNLKSNQTVVFWPGITSSLKPMPTLQVPLTCSSCKLTATSPSFGARLVRLSSGVSLSSNSPFHRRSHRETTRHLKTRSFLTSRCLIAPLP